MLHERDLSVVTGEGWYIAQLKPNGLGRARVNLERQGYQTFMPLVDTCGRGGKKGRMAPKALFPGYLFVMVDPSRQGWRPINSTFGVSRLVTLDDRQPARLPDEVMSALVARCDDRQLLQSSQQQFNEGDQVRAVAGALAEFVGTVEQLQPGNRIVVLLDIMGRKVRTHLPTWAIDLAS